MTIALILITIALGLWLVRQWSRGDLASPSRHSRRPSSRHSRPRAGTRPTPFHLPVSPALPAASTTDPPSNRRAA